MFVKIMYWNVRKGKDKTVIYGDLIREAIFNPISVLLESQPPCKSDEDIGSMLLTMVFDKTEKIICFPWETNDKVTEIYYMNENGKTIDKYIY